MGIFEKLFKKQASTTNIAPEPKESIPPVVSSAPPVAPKSQRHRITGVAHYQKNIMKLATKNPDYSLTTAQIIKEGRENEDIYQYIFSPVKTELIPEPSNPYDPNAVKVVVDGEHVGYIKKGSCSRVLKLIREDRIKKIDCRMRGGAYKCVVVNDIEDKDYETEREKRDFSIEITIYEK